MSFEAPDGIEGICWLPVGDETKSTRAASHMVPDDGLFAIRRQPLCDGSMTMSMMLNTHVVNQLTIAGECLGKIILGGALVEVIDEDLGGHSDARGLGTGANRICTGQEGCPIREKAKYIPPAATRERSEVRASETIVQVADGQPDQAHARVRAPYAERVARAGQDSTRRRRRDRGGARTQAQVKTRIAKRFTCRDRGNAEKSKWVRNGRKSDLRDDCG